MPTFRFTYCLAWHGDITESNCFISTTMSMHLQVLQILLSFESAFVNFFVWHKYRLQVGTATSSCNATSNKVCADFPQCRKKWGLFVVFLLLSSSFFRIVAKMLHYKLVQFTALLNLLRRSVQQRGMKWGSCRTSVYRGQLVFCNELEESTNVEKHLTKWWTSVNLMLRHLLGIRLSLVQSFWGTTS